MADYNENSVGYTGIGFGFEPVAGFIWGDIGMLFTSGSEVRLTEGDDVAAVADIADHFLFGTSPSKYSSVVGWGF